MSEKDDSFRIIDKRGSNTDTNSAFDSSEKISTGDGFIMKEKEEENSKNVHIDKIDFSTLVLSFATQAMINLGMTEDPTTKKQEKNLLAAQQNIDILNLLRDKTKGNLTKDENELLSNILTHLKLTYVEVSKS